MRVLFCGSRHWRDPEPIRRALLDCGEGTTVIHGGATGADSLAGSIARELGYRVEVFPADWKGHGRSAGVRRNARMLVEGKPHCVVAFPLPGSVGTWDMVRRARAAGVPVFMPQAGADLPSAQTGR